MKVMAMSNDNESSDLNKIKKRPSTKGDNKTI